MVFRFSLQYWDSFLMMINRTTRKIRNLESTWLISQLGIYIGIACFVLVAPLNRAKVSKKVGLDVA